MITKTLKILLVILTILIVSGIGIVGASASSILAPDISSEKWQQYEAALEQSMAEFRQRNSEQTTVTTQSRELIGSILNETNNHINIAARLAFTGFLVFFIAALILSILFCIKEFRKNKAVKAPFIPALPTAQPVFVLPSAKGLSQTFGSKYFEDEDKGIMCVNQWLADSYQIENVHCSLGREQRLGYLTNYDAIVGATISYDLSERHCAYQYAIVRLENFGYRLMNAERLRTKWKEYNPDIEIISSECSTHRRAPASAIMSSYGGSNRTQLYLLVRFIRNYNNLMKLDS